MEGCGYAADHGILAHPGGEPARAAVYEASEGREPVFIYQVIALDGDTAYILTFATAPEEKEDYFAQARTILDTFTFVAEGPIPQPDPA